MSEAILGKWQEVSEHGLDALYQAIGLPDPAPESEASFEYKGGEKGVYTEIFDTGESVTKRTFTSGVEVDGITTTVACNAITQTENLANGKLLNVKRVFKGNEMVTTLSSPNVAGVEATIIFKKV